MKQILETYKPIIDRKVKDLAALNASTNIPWSKDVGERLLSLTLRGKSVRGSIFLFMVDQFGLQLDDMAVSVAASLELLHTALLVHDDIVDHDSLRRGVLSIHRQYEELGSREQTKNAPEFGIAMAICAGDIAIFGGFSYLASISLDLPIYQALLKLITKEYLYVGFGEMNDIALSYLPKPPTKNDVISMYRLKTARYTFSLPLMAAAVVTKQNESTQKNLGLLGESLGLLFQITDDALTLSGSVDTVGKTIGNDIAENKNTLYKVLLFERMNASDRAFAETIFGHENVTEESLKKIKGLLHSYKVDETITEEMNALEKNALSQIATLTVSQKTKVELQGIVEYLKNRSS